MSLPPNPTFTDIEALIKKIPEQEGFENNFYTFLHVGSQILLLSLEDQYSASSVKTITLPDGSPAFTDENDINKLVDLLKNHGPQIKEILESVRVSGNDSEKQVGGDGTAEDKGPLEKLIDIAKMAYISPEEISFDRQFLKLTDYWDRLDQLNRALSSQLGLVALVNKVKVDPFVMVPLPGPVPPVKVQFPMRLALPLVNMLLEVTRIFFAIVPFGTIPMQFFTLIQTLFDIARGEWKYGIFTMMGFFNGGLLIFGVFCKLIRDVWLLMEPNLSKQIRLDLWLAGRSMFVGFWLRMITVFMPDFARNATETALLPMTAILTKVNTTIENIESTVNKTTEPLGVKAIFPKVEFDMIPSLDSINALQTAISQPEIFCAPEFQQILAPIKNIPPIRLFIELLNIPLDDQMVALRCKGIQTTDIATALVDKLAPRIEIIPGGATATIAQGEKVARQLETLATIDSLTDLFSSGFVSSLQSQLKDIASSGLTAQARDLAVKEAQNKMKEEAMNILKSKLKDSIGPALTKSVEDALNDGIGPVVNDTLGKIIEDNLSKMSTGKEEEVPEESKEEKVSEKAPEESKAPEEAPEKVPEDSKGEESLKKQLGGYNELYDLAYRIMHGY